MVIRLQPLSQFAATLSAKRCANEYKHLNKSRMLYFDLLIFAKSYRYPVWRRGKIKTL